MKALVTGGAGFIGSSLVRALLAEGHRVRVLDDFSTASAANLAGVDDPEVVTGDVRSMSAVEAAVEGVEVVFHLAALPSVARSIADPGASHEVNATGTLNVLRASCAGGARRVVYASSSSIYGDTPVLPKQEDMPVSPRSPYAASKLAGEAYCRGFTHGLELETVSLRFFNVFGPRQDPSSEYAAVIPRFATRMLAGEPPEVFGDGLQTRDFTYVDNVVRALIQAAGAEAAAGEVLNVGCGERISLLDLIDLLNDCLGMSSRPVHLEPRPGDVRDSLADISKAHDLIGYEPRVSVRGGLATTARWFARERALAG